MRIEDEIQNIDSKIYQMLDAVIGYLRSVFDYYLDDKRGEDDNFVVDDDRINLYEREIESLCMQILLREKVYSGDLRDIIGNFRTGEDVERMGDQTYDIKNTTDMIKRLPEKKKVIKGMDELMGVVMKMVEDSLHCFVKMDTKQAEVILSMDDIVDKKFWDMVGVIVELDEKREISCRNAILQTMVVKYLERIADHATNIAEWVVFMVNGFHKDKVII